MIIATTWRTSTYSKGETNCVEVADAADGGRAVRDTRNRDRGVLVFPAGEWRAFLADLDAL